MYYRNLNSHNELMLHKKDMARRFLSIPGKKGKIFTLPAFPKLVVLSATENLTVCCISYCLINSKLSSMVFNLRVMAPVSIIKNICVEVRVELKGSHPGSSFPGFYSHGWWGGKRRDLWYTLFFYKNAELSGGIFLIFRYNFNHTILEILF